jgi:rhodanese-related sulfurtransferase
MPWNQYLEFIGNHPLLFLAFFGVLGILALFEARARFSGMKSIGATEATVLSNRSNALFLDVREDKDFRAGHIPDAVHIPLKQLPDRVGELEKYKDRPVIAYCRSGNTSTAAGGLLKKHGFDNLYNLRGGVMAWQSANLPLGRD